MQDGVIYFLMGDKHAVQLVVSLRSLRDFWQGPVAILCGDDKALSIAEQCASDVRLDPVLAIRFDALERQEGWTRSGRGYMNKAHALSLLSPFERTVFFDADTLIVGDFRELWPRDEFVHLTQFCSWTCKDRRIRGRVELWREAMPKEVARALAWRNGVDKGLPAINTGVMAWTRETKRFLDAWRETTAKNVIFMADELAAQLIFLDFPHVVFPHEYNASPIHSRELGEVKVWHNHGMKCVVRQNAHRIWWPHYERCLEDNIAQLAYWTPAGDRRLKQFLENPEKVKEEYGWT